MSWAELIPKDSLETLDSLLTKAERERKEGKKIYPEQEDILRSLRLTPPESLKVCIIGQDPYHTPGAANGLAFSVNHGTPIPPSLRNILKEVPDTVNGGDLTPWAEQGVLLLNTVLTVYEHQANSHANWGWQKFTTSIIDAAVQLPQPVVFILWGAQAISLLDHIRLKAAVPQDNIIFQHLIQKDIILSSHPSPLSAKRKCGEWPPFVNSSPFFTANLILKLRGVDPIDWRTYQ